MNKIKFGELRLNDSSKRHIQDCIDSNWITSGKKVELFEKNWQDLFGYKHCVMMNSGTSADTAACMALYDFGANPGDEIICPALSFIATGNSIRASGFTPKFVDVHRETLNIKVEDIENQITSKTAAIMAVNLMGRPCDLDIIQQIAQNYNLKVIVDNCEGYGSKYKGKFALEYADMETTSFYTAHICTSCEGGSVNCHDENIRESLFSIRNHGRRVNDIYFDHVRFGLNFKQSDLHASVGIGELENFQKTFDKRKENLYNIRDSVRGFEHIAWFIEEDHDHFLAPHAFSITLKPQYCHHIHTLQSLLTKFNIEWKRNFGSMPHHQCFSYLGIDKDAFPNAKYVGNYGIHIGCHQFLTDEEVGYICTTLQNIFKGMK